MFQHNLTRFYQLYNIAFDNGTLKATTCNELKYQLLHYCKQLDPEGPYGYTAFNSVVINQAKITSLYQKFFS